MSEIALNMKCSDGLVVIPLETYSAMQQEISALKELRDSVVDKVFINTLGHKPTVEVSFNDALITELAKAYLHANFTDKQLAGFTLTDKLCVYSTSLAT